MHKALTGKYLSPALALLAALSLFAAVNALCRGLAWRLDLSADRVHTLAPGTLRSLDALERPVVFRFYRGGGENAMPAAWRAFADRVEDLLNEYVSRGHGKIILEKHDPRPDSFSEDSAAMDGMVKNGDFYLGLAVSQLSRLQSIPFFSPEKESEAEYEITRALRDVSRPARKRLGLMSYLQIGGGDSPVMATAGRKRPPWIFVQELKTVFDVQAIPSNAKRIDPALDALLLIHPKDLNADALYAVDQYLLGGGKLLVAVDPYCISESLSSEKKLFGEPPEPGSSALPQFFAAWGLQNVEPNLVVVSPADALRDRDKPGGMEYPVILSLGPKNLAPDELATAGLAKLDFVFSGALQGSPAPGLTKKVLAWTSTDAGQLKNFSYGMLPADILKSFTALPGALPLVVRLDGKFKSAYPEQAAGHGGLLASKRPSAVLALADADLFYDPFCVDGRAKSPTYGKKINNNLEFIQNAVDQLVGDVELIKIRDRRVTRRPFTKLDDYLAEDLRQYRAETAKLEARRQEAQRRVNALQESKSDNQKFVWSAEQLEELAKLRAEMDKTNRDLKDIRRNFRDKKAAVETRIKTMNLVLVPLLVILAGLLMALSQRQQEARPKP